MKEELSLLGYDINIKIYSPIEFGIPQNRKRIFIVGSLNGLKGFSFDSVDENKNSEIDLDKFISSTFPSSSKLDSHKIYALEIWQNFLDEIPKSQKLPGFPIWSMEFGADYPTEINPVLLSKKKLSQYKGSFGTPLSLLNKKQQIDLLPNYAKTKKPFPDWKKRFINHNREFYKKHKIRIDKVLPYIKTLEYETLQKFEWNLGYDERIIKNNFIQFRPSGIRIKKANFFPSLVCSSTQLPVIGWQNRYITTNEALKLQSLEGLKLPKSKNASMKALGNAVNSRIVYFILKSLLNDDLNYKTINPKFELAI
jgi:DNA (cytosine-5)-methyltransferase 1